MPANLASVSIVLLGVSLGTRTWAVLGISANDLVQFSFYEAVFRERLVMKEHQ